MEHSDTKDLITTADAASILGVTSSTLSKWRADHRGPPFYRVGGVYRYDRAEVLAYRKRHRVDPSVEVA